MTAYKIYDELAAFLAQAAPDHILAYRPSDEVQGRYNTLVGKKKENVLTKDENSELEHYFMLEHIFRLAKIRAASS